MSLLPAKVIKMSGAGNTFALIDARAGSQWLSFEKQTGLVRTEIVRRVCDEVFGLKCDGVVFIENGNSEVDFCWDFFNNDGSSAEMCGNAARCAARFCELYIPESPNKNIRFQTGAGKVSAELMSPGTIKVSMPEAFWVKDLIQLKMKSSAVEDFALVNTGVPHLVQKIHSLDEKEGLKEVAREARHHQDIKPQGANTTFYVKTNDPSHIQAVTFERGVENYTLACGTGAVAAAMVVSKETGLMKIKVDMPGGSMDIEFIKDNPRPFMTGQALVIGEFHYNTEVFK